MKWLPRVACVSNTEGLPVPIWDDIDTKEKQIKENLKDG